MAEEKLLVEMYTDGACSGNPGAGGYGTILRFKDKTGTYHEKEPDGIRNMALGYRDQRAGS